MKKDKENFIVDKMKKEKKFNQTKRYKPLWILAECVVKGLPIVMFLLAAFYAVHGLHSTLNKVENRSGCSVIETDDNAQQENGVTNFLIGYYTHYFISK